MYEFDEEVDLKPYGGPSEVMEQGSDEPQDDLEEVDQDA